MRLAFVTRRLPPDVDAVGNCTYQLALALTRYPVQLDLFTSESQSVPSPPASVNIHPSPSNWGWRGLFSLIGRIKETRPDAISLQYVPHLYGRYGINLAVSAFPLLARLVLRRPVVTTHHEFPVGEPRGWKNRILHLAYLFQDTLLLMGSSRVIVPTVEQEKRVRNRFPFLAHKICRIPMGASILPDVSEQASSQAQTTCPSGITLGMFGTGHSWRQYDTALELLAELLRKGFRVQLICLGDIQGTNHRYFGRLQSLAEKIGVEHQVEWTGRLDAREISRRLQSVDLFLALQRGGITARNSSLMTALAHGLPVIASRGPQSDPWLFDSGAVVPVEAEDAPRIAEALLPLVSNSNLRSEMAVRARRFYDELVSWPVLAQRFLDVVKPLLGEPTP